jgi:cell wall assembly regulator SMI1
MDLQALLIQLDKDLLRQTPELASRLRPGASKLEVAAVESQLGLELPEAVRVAYEWHDGCLSSAAPCDSIELFGGPWRWLTLGELQALWLDNCGAFDDSDPYFYGPEDDGWAQLPIRPWQTAPPQWIPIANLEGWAGNLYVDLLPGPSGTKGQIVAENIHAMAKSVFAASLEAFFWQIGNGLRDRSVLAIRDLTDAHWEWRLASGAPLEIPGARRVFG